jgi:hypothetical protein
VIYHGSTKILWAVRLDFGLGYKAAIVAKLIAELTSTNDVGAGALQGLRRASGVLPPQNNLCGPRRRRAGENAMVERSGGGDVALRLPARFARGRTTHFNSIDLFSRVSELFSLRVKITFVSNSSSVYARFKYNLRKDTLII